MYFVSIWDFLFSILMMTCLFRISPQLPFCDSTNNNIACTFETYKNKTMTTPTAKMMKITQIIPRKIACSFSALKSCVHTIKNASQHDSTCFSVHSWGSSKHHSKMCRWVSHTHMCTYLKLCVWPHAESAYPNLFVRKHNLFLGFDSVWIFCIYRNMNVISTLLMS